MEISVTDTNHEWASIPANKELANQNTFYFIEGREGKNCLNDALKSAKRAYN